MPNYWLVGATFGDDDMTDTFIRRGYWEQSPSSLPNHTRGEEGLALEEVPLRLTQQFGLRFPVQQMFDHLLVLLRLGGAGGVDQLPAGTQRSETAPQEGALKPGHSWEVRLGQPPAKVRVGPQGGGPGAGGVQQDEVEEAPERGMDQIGLHGPQLWDPVEVGSALHLTEAGQAEIAGDQAGAGSFSGLKNEGLPPGGRTEVAHGTAPAEVAELSDLLTGRTHQEAVAPAVEGVPDE